MLKRVLWWIWQFVWCLPQNLAGFCLHLAFRRNGFTHFHGAVVTAWKFHACASVGSFIFMGERSMQERKLLVHEFGHTLQSAVLGWLYLPVVWLPSMIWFSVPVLRKWRHETKYSYYRFYTESWANCWGEKWCGEPSMGLALID